MPRKIIQYVLTLPINPAEKVLLLVVIEEVMTRGECTITLAEMGRRVRNKKGHMSRPTAHRVMNSLVREEFLYRDDSRRTFIYDPLLVDILDGKSSPVQSTQ